MGRDVKDRSDPELLWGGARDAGRTAAPWMACPVLLTTWPPRVFCGILTPYPCLEPIARNKKPGQGHRPVLTVSSSAQTVIYNDGIGVSAHWLIFCFLLKWNLYRKKKKTNSECNSSSFIKLVNICSLLFRKTD